MIKHLLFDMDNTLYPASSRMGDAITARMLRFTAQYLRCSEEEAVKMRRARLPFYGTTLEWLRAECALSDADTRAFLSAVHPASEIEDIDRDPELRPFLRSLGLPMTVLTNAPMEHAARILAFLQVDDLFLDVFDICANHFHGKPHESAYRAAVEAHGFTLAETLFFDDHPKYIAGYKALGGVPVLVSDRLDHKTLPADLQDIIQIQSVYEAKRALAGLHLKYAV
ncbi:HAD-IA family hydrolase [Treponema endosymbiont of Eucomonympha sp.]|uniref:HAD-IA family hydrolase n=1 Tax=Treponema endosymbiont of Eucomonympha sp. TaxID=1580831 RepID=UPI000750DD13|nr:HAD-IA family hydrolase [Treponema endosymbiont of Eucomonympha sp.]